MNVDKLMQHKQELRFNLIKAVRDFEETTEFYVEDIQIKHSGLDELHCLYGIKLKVILGDKREPLFHCFQPQCCL